MIEVPTKDSGQGVPDGFLALPPLVYAGDPQWIPEDPAEVARAFGPENPWFGETPAGPRKARAFAIPGQARAAAFWNPTIRIDGRPVAFFGFFESRGDVAATARLFQAVADFARSKGALDLYGPIDFTTYGRYRLRLSAEPGAVTFPGEPYNPPGAPALLEAQGFEVAARYVTHIVPAALAPQMRALRRPAFDALLGQGYRFAPLDHTTWLRLLPELHGLVDEIFGQNFAYTPLSYTAFAEALGARFIEKACPTSSVLAFGPEGDLAGFLLSVPHYGPLVVQAAGRERVPVGALSYERHKPMLDARGFRVLLAKSVGVSARHRRRGLMNALFYQLSQRSLDQVDGWFGALTREGNHPSRFASALPIQERTYALYRKALDREAP